MTETVVYLYAIGEPALTDDPVVGTLTGVTDAPVHLLGTRELVAAVSAVDAGDFTESALRHNLENLSWVATTARAHHGVVDALAHHHTVAPVRLATVYRTEDGVRALLDHHAEDIAGVLERVRDHGEWAVKAFRAAEPEPDPDAPADSARPGTSYLLRRRSAHDRAAATRKALSRAVEQLDQALSRYAAARRRYPPQDPQLTGDSEEMLLNAAYLVDQGRTEQFCQVARQRDGDRLRLALSGPWPAYSFTAVEQI